MIERLKPFEFREPLVAADWSRPLTLLFAGAPVAVAAGRPETVSEVAGWLRLPRDGDVAGGADWFEAEVFPVLLAADCGGFAVRPSDPEDEPLVAADWSRPLTLLFAGAPVTLAAGRPETVSEVAGWLRLPRGGGTAGSADWFEAEVFPALLAADCDGFAVRPSDPEDEPLVARDEGTCFRSDGSALSVSPDGRAVCTVRAGLAVSAGY